MWQEYLGFTKQSHTGCTRLDCLVFVPSLPRMPHFCGVGRRLQASAYPMRAPWPTANILVIQSYFVHGTNLQYCGWGFVGTGM